MLKILGFVDLLPLAKPNKFSLLILQTIHVEHIFVGVKKHIPFSFFAFFHILHVL